MAAFQSNAFQNNAFWASVAAAVSALVNVVMRRRGRR